MKRIATVEWIRALSAICIVLFHYTTKYEEKFGHVDAYPINISYGYMAVAVFFVLSGFLAILSLERKNGGGSKLFFTTLQTTISSLLGCYDINNDSLFFLLERQGCITNCFFS